MKKQISLKSVLIAATAFAAALILSIGAAAAPVYASDESPANVIEASSLSDIQDGYDASQSDIVYLISEIDF